MALFDIIVQKNKNFNGYTGEPPSNESEYNAMKDDMFKDTPPTWEKIKSEMDSYVDARFSGNKKLLDLGLTQEEATALTGYTPPS
tara:strand:- start:56 stop:310 length:255 start_codon:yes stop_codon:yes gene_type:complete